MPKRLTTVALFSPRTNGDERGNARLAREPGKTGDSRARIFSDLQNHHPRDSTLLPIFLLCFLLAFVPCSLFAVSALWTPFRWRIERKQERVRFYCRQDFRCSIRCVTKRAIRAYRADGIAIFTAFTSMQIGQRWFMHQASLQFHTGRITMRASRSL